MIRKFIFKGWENWLVNLHSDKVIVDAVKEDVNVGNEKLKLKNSTTDMVKSCEMYSATLFTN